MKKQYYKYWGKARKRDDGGHDYHLLVYHCLDVAAVASAWFDKSSFLQAAFCSDKRYSVEKNKAWLLFFTAFHDIGKTDLRFQLKVPECINDFHRSCFEKHGLSANDCLTYNHGTGGVYWVQKEFKKILEIGEEIENPKVFSDSILDFIGEDSDDSQWKVWKPWVESVCEHHGRKIEAETVDDSLPITFPKLMRIRLREERKELIHSFESLFLKPVGLSISDIPPAHSNMLSGFCSICDWLGSNSTEDYFRFESKEIELDKYFFSKKADAEKILDVTGLVGKPKSYQGIDKLLKKGHSPRQLQTKVDELPLKQGLTIIEGPTGSGKTELAIAYAWKLLERNLADSIVFALPSQATSNGMLPRLDRMSGILFEKHPNLVLAHGNARFNKNFAEIRDRANTVQGQQDAASQCNQWLSQSRKRVFLGQIAVCTVDQVLMSVLPIKHGFVRQFCTGRSVLIIDEVHAYDQYMYGLLLEVLRNQKSSGGSAILLSATLPGFQKEQLLDAWGAVHSDIRMEYPLITNSTANGLKSIILEKNEYPIESDIKSVHKQIELSENMLPSDDLIHQIVNTVSIGVNVAIICNLVDDAQRIYQTLSELIETPEKVRLFHSRYTLNDRQQIEEDILIQFGEGPERVKGMVLVSTQVIEQSLNVDFDWMITQLCPVDLLFQRIGRLQRFSLDNRPAGYEQPLCTVLAPKDEFDFGTHNLIYQNVRVLWRTLQLLIRDNNPMIFPYIYREWVEKVYQEASWVEEPELLSNLNEEYQNEIAFIKQLKAKMMIESSMEALDDNYSTAQILTRDGEMSVSIIPVVKSGKGTMLLSGEILEKIKRDDRAEAVYMNSVNIPHSWWKWMEEFLDKDDENNLWFQMDEREEGEYCRNLLNYNICYSKKLGLKKEAE